MDNQNEHIVQAVNPDILKNAILNAAKGDGANASADTNILRLMALNALGKKYKNI